MINTAESVYCTGSKGDIQMKQKMQIVKWMGKRAKPYYSNLAVLILAGGILSLAKVYMALISKDFIDNLINGIGKATTTAGILFGITVILQLIAKWVSSVFLVRTKENLSGSLKAEAYRHLSDANWLEYAKYHSGDIAARVTGDTQVVQNGIIDGLTGGASSLIGLVAAFAALLSLNPMLAAFSIVFGPVSLLLGGLVGASYMSIHEKSQEADGRYRSYLQECLEHMLVIKTFGKERDSYNRLRELQGEKKRLALKRNYTTAITNTLVMTGLWVGFLVIICWGAAYILDSNLTVGTATAYIQLIIQVMLPFIELAGLLPLLFSAAGSSRRLMEIEGMGTEKSENKPRTEGFEEIILKDISFSYNSQTPVLQAVTLSIRLGDTIALTGASGEGKTTLIYLIMQLLKPVSGHMVIRNKGISYDLDEYFIRHLISYVPQGNTLFSGTIEENIRMGEEEADREEQLEALEAACAWEFVSELPEGLQTVIGERGMGLSEGQAQRIAIARALIRKTPILILDEATSALDMETEKRILGNIKSLNMARTCIIITHRISIFPYCRRILKLKDGRLQETDIDTILSEFYEAAGFAVFYKSSESAATEVV